MEVGDRSEQGRAYTNLGVASHSLGDFQKAIEYHEKDLALAVEIGDRFRKKRAYANLGIAYHSLGDFRKAIECHEKDLSIAIEIGDRLGEGRAYANLGIAYHGLDDFRKAIEYHKRGLNLAMEIGDRDGEKRAYANLGIAYQSLGDFRKVIECHEQDLKIAMEIGDRAGEGRAYANLGIAYHSLGDFRKAIERHEKDLTLAVEIGDPSAEKRAYANLGIAYHSLGDFRKAIECHEKDLTLAKEIGDRSGGKRAYANLGIAYHSLGDFRKAINYHEKDLNIAMKIGDRLGEGRAYANLGIAYHGLDDFRKAIEYHERGLNLAMETGDRDGEKRAYANLGIAYQSQGDFRKAIDCHEQDLSIAIEIGDQAGKGKAYHNIGNVYFSCGQFKNAVDYFVSAVEVFNTLRSLLKSNDDLKISFREQYEKVYTSLWKSLLRIGKIEEALFVAEQGRAQTLSDNLLIQYKIASTSAYASKSIDSKETITDLLSKLSTRMIFLGIDHEGHMINIWYLSKGNKVVFRKGKLKGNSTNQDRTLVLLQTALTEIGAGVGVKCENRTLDEITRDCPSSRQVNEAEEPFRSSNNPFKPLHDAVIGAICDMFGSQGDELVIVSDGALCFIPWAAVIDSMRIRTVPSLTSYHLILSAPEGYHKKTGALLVGNPYLEQLKKPLEYLPFAQKEVEMIATILNTRPLTGRQATKAEVMNQMSAVGLIHIAAHGDKTTGEIALSPNPGWTSQFPEREDYILKMCDVKAANLRANLVVLSCCHSGRGRILKGEGVVGIARAFLAAGARSVLVSLWAIDDEATLVFMESFYQHLKERKTVTSAVHESMKSLRESEKFSLMKYWAPFQVMGDDVKVEFEADDDVSK